MGRMRVGLSNKAQALDDAEVHKLAKALQVQVTRDLGPVWNVDAEIIVLDGKLDIPHGVSPIIIADNQEVKGAHQIQAGVAFAIVSAQVDWRLAASHELIEMLVDPAGEKTKWSVGLEVVNGAVRETKGRVEYLIEACDPIEDPVHSYEIHGVRVSDFYTERYFDDTYQRGVKYSHAGSVTRPREVKPNGYLSWYIPGTRQFRQLRNFGGYEIIDMPGAPEAGESKRKFVDKNTKTPRTHPHLYRKPAEKGARS